MNAVDTLEKFGESYSHKLWDVFQSAIKKSNITPSILKMVHNFLCHATTHGKIEENYVLSVSMLQSGS